MEAKEEKKANPQLIARLEDAIGHDNVKASKMERLLYSHDLAPLPNVTQIGFLNVPDVVVRPRSTEDVSKIVKIAADRGRADHPARLLLLGTRRFHAMLRRHSHRLRRGHEQDLRDRPPSTSPSPPDRAPPGRQCMMHAWRRACCSAPTRPPSRPRPWVAGSPPAASAWAA